MFKMTAKTAQSADLDYSSRFKQFKHLFKMFKMTANTAQRADLDYSSLFKQFKRLSKMFKMTAKNRSECRSRLFQPF